jgi:hypothetical protein
MHKDWDICLKLFGCLQCLLECHKICGITCFKCTWLIAWQITTVGYGDITPNSNWGRLIVICVILGAVIILPVQINHILQLASRRCSSFHLHSLTLIGCTPWQSFIQRSHITCFLCYKKDLWKVVCQVVSYIERISRGESGEWICFVFFVQTIWWKVYCEEGSGISVHNYQWKLDISHCSRLSIRVLSPNSQSRFFLSFFFFFLGFHPLLSKFSAIWHK